MVPIRFKRVAEAFGDAGRVRLCESSGSDHSPAESLSDLVNSFMEREGNKEEKEFDGESLEDHEIVSENKCRDYYETRDGLKGYFVNCKDDDDDEEEDDSKSRIVAAVEKALREVRNFVSEDFKRPLMARLRLRGFDAGLCKSKWEKNGRCPAGYYEYIDVLLSGNRYIVEISLAKEFEIARPTACYEELLNQFPQIFVGKVEELKHVVKLMCKSMKKSMKTKEMYTPPWRRYDYVHAKWFSSYKRTTNEFVTSVDKKKSVAASGGGEVEDEEGRRKKSVGFMLLPPLMYACREGVKVNGKCGLKMGNLAAALQDSTAVLL